MDFRIEGLDPLQFSHLYGLDDAALRAQGVRRVFADQSPGYPDRVELRDAELGASLLLLNFEHLPFDTPYRSRHAIFVREGASRRFDEVNVVPDVLRPRLLSLRGFDSQGNMVDADVVQGDQSERLIERLLATEGVAWIHAHFAKRGCFAATIRRA